MCIILTNPHPEERNKDKVVIEGQRSEKLKLLLQYEEIFPTILICIYLSLFGTIFLSSFAKLVDKCYETKYCTWILNSFDALWKFNRNFKKINTFSNTLVEKSGGFVLFSSAILLPEKLVWRGRGRSKDLCMFVT